MEIEENEISEHLQSYIIGVTDVDLPVSSSQEIKLINNHMVSQANQRINIVSRNLDSKIYNDEKFCHALSTLIKKNPKTEIHILVKDINKINNKHHLLIDLYQKFDSFISIKIMHEEYSSYNHAYISIDHTALIFQEFADLYQGIANYSSRLLAKNLRLEFTKIWDLSEPASSLRKLNL